MGSNPATYTDSLGLFMGLDQMIRDVTGSAVAAYAFGLDAGIYSLLEEGAASRDFDIAVAGLQYAVAGAFAGGMAAWGFGFTAGGNILGGSIAGGFTSYGLGQGYMSGAATGAGVSAGLEILFAAWGAWRDAAVVGGGAIGGGFGQRFMNRVLRGRGYMQGVCFGAGTLVLLPNGEMQPIEEIRVGDVVSSWSWDNSTEPEAWAESDTMYWRLPDAQPDTEQEWQSALVPAAPVPQSPFPHDYERIEAEHWRTIRLTMDSPRSGRRTITLLRPLAWLELTGAQIGGTLDILMPEMGVAGAAYVVAIEACPEIDGPSQPGARPVTGTFITTNAGAIDLSIEGLPEPITTTSSHPFWSLDREAWIAAGDLARGEKLRTLAGTVLVSGVTAQPRRVTVYNLEIHRDHTFFVTDAHLWVHNICIPEWVQSGNNLVSWLKELAKGRPQLLAGELDDIVLDCQTHGVKVRLDPPHNAPGNPGNVPHLNIGENGQVHLEVPPGYTLP